MNLVVIDHVSINTRQNLDQPADQSQEILAQTQVDLSLRGLGFHLAMLIRQINPAINGQDGISVLHADLVSACGIARREIAHEINQDNPNWSEKRIPNLLPTCESDTMLSSADAASLSEIETALTSAVMSGHIGSGDLAEFVCSLESLAIKAVNYERTGSFEPNTNKLLSQEADET